MARESSSHYRAVGARPSALGEVGVAESMRVAPGLKDGDFWLEVGKG